MTIDELMLLHLACKRSIDKHALYLGVFFVLEYIVQCRMYISSPSLAFVAMPMMCITPILAFLILRSLRERILGGYIKARTTFLYGIRLFLLAGLIEAFFIYVYNEFIVQDNLRNLNEAVATQLASSIDAMGKLMPSFNTTALEDSLAAVRSNPIPSAIVAAKDHFFNTLSIGFIIVVFISFIVRKHPRQGAEDVTL